MRKKLLSALLATAMVVSVCACGNTEPANGSESETKQSEVESSVSTSQSTEVVEENDSLYPLVDEPITVTGVVIGEKEYKDIIVWDKVAEITGVNFEWITVDKEAINTFLSADWEFDFIHTRTLADTIVNDYGVLGGRFADYNDYLELMPNLQKTIEEYPEAKKAMTEINGEMYSLPYIEASATATQVRAYYRTDLLEKYDIPVPKTTEEFYEALKTYKEKNGTAGFSGASLRETQYWGPMLYAAFGTSVQPDFEDDGTGTVVYNRTSEQYKLYLEFMNRLYKEELIQQEYMTNDINVAIGLARSGDTVFYADEAHSLMPEDFADGEMHLSVMAPLTSEYSDDQEVLRQLIVSKGGMYLNAESENLEALVQALDIMYATEEVVEGSGLHGMSFCYGIEGVDYIKNDDGTYELVTPEGFDSFTAYQYGTLIVNNAGRATDLEGYITSTPGNAQARQIGFRDNIFPYACDASKVFPASFIKFTTDEQDVITTRYTDIQKHVTEMRDKFITGIVDIETGWDEYCKAIETMGIDEVLEVYQAAYDRWNQ
ncbi:MAG: extracellular solute-binding protein [Lachnospiraceae bacterium]|nr:extracellular solute-binding protein [Lachnospiraceae bacterium]